MFTKTEIEKYFNAEKSASLIFLILGIVSIIIAINLYFFLKTNLYKGAAIPVLVVGMLLTIVGFSVYKKCDADRIKNVYAFDLKPSDLKEKEIPRMVLVMKNFKILKFIELILIMIGVLLFFYFKNNNSQQFWKGFGCTLLIMGFLIFSADYFAERRGEIYLNELQSFTKNLF